MSHLPDELFDPTARAPRHADTFSQSLQDHSTEYRLRKLTAANHTTFRKVKIPRSERTPKRHVPVEQRMQGLRRDTAEANIRRVKRQAAKKLHAATVKVHRYIRRSQELRQRILHARDETVDLLIPLFEELGSEPSAVLEARGLAKKLDRKIAKTEDKIGRVERRIIRYQKRIFEINKWKEVKIRGYEAHIRNLTRRTQVGTEGGEEDQQASANLRRSAELWLHTHLNRHTRSCASFDRPLHRSKSRRGSSAEGVRVRWSGDLSIGDTVTIRPTESGASGEISRSASGDSLASSSIINIDAVLAIPADAVSEGLELDLQVVKREPQPRQLNPQDFTAVDESDRKAKEVVTQITKDWEATAEGKASESPSSISQESQTEASTDISEVQEQAQEKITEHIQETISNETPAQASEETQPVPDEVTYPASSKEGGFIGSDI
ncbi:hypothetical protein TWF694_011193 [Orbilia ellipsospora]|uniref:Uncharacterized protein n=1 Tax=Orbilia ellipsospora TaxID=2528407 RepID=A0AAV9X8B6_9PEZI